MDASTAVGPTTDNPAKAYAKRAAQDVRLIRGAKF